jgi:hypothetical protein
MGGGGAILDRKKKEEGMRNEEGGRRKKEEEKKKKIIPSPPLPSRVLFIQIIFAFSHPRVNPRQRKDAVAPLLPSSALPPYPPHFPAAADLPLHFGPFLLLSLLLLHTFGQQCRCGQ